MDKSTRSNAALYWVIGVIAVSMVIFVYFVISDAPKTLAKIKLSYFTNEQEIADSISKRLMQEIAMNSSFWIGLEPDKVEQYEVLSQIKSNFEKNISFQKVIIDAELALPEALVKSLKATDVVSFKENLYIVGEKINDLEKAKVPYLLVTASIYSNSLLVDNPLHKLKAKYELKPMTFSFGYMVATPEDENKLLFKCDTEDHSGIKDWACFVVNKGRASRRRLELNNAKPWIGLMDLSGENDYIVLLKKK